MRLMVLKAMWGMTGPLEDQLRRIAEAGYEGVEAKIDQTEDVAELKRLLRQFGLGCVALLNTKGENWTEHAMSFRTELEQALTLEPVAINSHSAREKWAWDDQLRFFECALEDQRWAGLPLSHETHRRRSFFVPHTTARLLRYFPELMVTADFSHWCCSAESMLEDQADDVALACERTRHIHGRVGYPEGPQVPDPRAPEWAPYTAQHEAWWEAMMSNLIRIKWEVITFVSEYGPFPYQHVLPFTQEAVSDPWELSLYTAGWARERFSQLTA